jgi:signal transduction histidine kinase
MADVVHAVLVGEGKDAEALEGALPRRIDGFDVQVRHVPDAASARERAGGEKGVIFLFGDRFLEHLGKLEACAPIFCVVGRDCRESRIDLLGGGASEVIARESVRTDLLAAVIKLALCVHEVRALHAKAQSRVRDVESRLQSHKMEAVGRLAGGIAHEFNNLLTAITGYADLLLARTKDQPDLRHDVYEIKTAAGRASSITRQLLTFSRRHPVRPHVFDLRGVIKGMEPALRRLVGDDVRLEVELPSAASYIRAEAAQIEQIIGNLAVNARDAMPSGGKLSIRVHDPEGGESVRISVCDTGRGIHQDVLPRIFEPFFTTKGPEEGAGLGLAIVYSLVRQCGGQILAESHPSEGATFQVLLPRAAAPSPARGESEEQFRPRTILLVEDQDVVRSVTRRLLEAAGYRVIEAQGGEEALALQDRLSEVDLLLTDVVMPVLSGVDIAERLAERRPDLSVLFMSGFTRDEVLHDSRTDLPAHFLQKPFTKDQLIGRVRDALAAAGG